MPYKLTPEIVLSEKFLAMAEYWRNCAAHANDPWRSDMMNATAKECEIAAARAINPDIRIPGVFLERARLDRLARDLDDLRLKNSRSEGT
jgi:hypothetical protein